MSIDIRENIKENFKDVSRDEIKSAIDSSLIEKNEITLPGLGVFLEILWEYSSDNEKEMMINIIKNHL